MSDKEWYEGLTAEELEGKHVHAVYKTGTVVEGRLERDGLMYVSHTRQVAVLGPGKGGSWELSPGVESVSLVWDERDWEQIRTEDISKADAIVVNGRLWPVSSIPTRGGFLTKDGSAVPISFVSCALRRRHKLPIKPGAYRGIDGALLIRVETRNRNRWIYASADFAESGSFDDEEVARRYLPLTPVHFVDGRAE